MNLMRCVHYASESRDNSKMFYFYQTCHEDHIVKGAPFQILKSAFTAVVHLCYKGIYI